MELTKRFKIFLRDGLTTGCNLGKGLHACSIFILFMCLLNNGAASASVDIWYADLPGSGLIRYIGPPPADKAAFDQICDDYWSGNGITDHDVWYGPDGPGNHSLCVSPTGYGNKWMLSRPTGLVCSAQENIDPDTGMCGCPGGKTLKNGQCVTPPSDCEVGNPCDPATGNKSQTEVDFTLGGAGLELVRAYNSSAPGNVGFGVGWTSTFHKSLVVSNDQLIVLRDDGRGDPWVKSNGAWSADSDSQFLLSEHTSGFTVTLGTGGSEHYDYAGNIQFETQASGQTTHYSYDTEGRLSTVTGPFGHTSSLSYDSSNRIVSITDPGNHSYLYSYDNNNNLTQIEYPDGSVRLYHYEDTDLRSHLSGVTDENGDRFATYTYDREGRVISSEHASTDNGAPQEQFLFDYSAESSTEVTDPVGQLWDYSYEQNLGIFKLINRISREDGKGITRQFDGNNNLVFYTDEEGRTTIHTYNNANQRIKTIEAAGTTESRTVGFEYLSADADLATSVTTPSVFSGAVREVETTYDSNLNVISLAIQGFDPGGVPVSRTTTFQYNTLGQVMELDGPRTDVSDRISMTYYECDTGGKCGQVASITSAGGYTTTFDSYDSDGFPMQKTDPLGVITKWTYDARNRVTSIVQISPEEEVERTTSFTYDSVGQLIAMSKPDKTTLAYVYDSAHNLRSVSDNLGNRVEYVYDLKGNRTQENVKDPDGILVRSLHTAYDLRDRIKSTSRGGSITQTLQDAVGNLISISDPNHNPDTIHRYDYLHRLTRTLDKLSNPIAYEYDVQDNLIQVTAPNTAQTTYEYDDLGNLLREISPDRGAVFYTYDAAGNMTSIHDARGVSATYTYDVFNQVTNIDYPGMEQDLTFVYDSCKNGIQRLCEITDQTGITSFEYDPFGNIVAHIKSENGTNYVTRFSYDTGDRITQITYPHGGTVTYYRDAAGRITDADFEIDDFTLPILRQRAYRADGLVNSHVLGNGLIDLRQYDVQGRLMSQDLGAVDSRSYQYDANGNILSLNQSASGDSEAFNAAYVYDVLDRIIEETGPADDFEFTYDANGNRLSKTKNGVIRSYQVEVAANRLSQANNKGVVLDEAGNTLSDRNGKRAFSYNESGRLSKIYKEGTLKATYLYNAQGLRTRKIKETSNGQKTFTYHYDLNGNLIAETKNNKALRYYIWIDTQPVAQLRLKQAGSGKVSVKHATYITTDHLQTPRLGTDENQNIVWRWDGDSFGQSKADKDPDRDDNNRNIRLRFPGQIYDAESGLYYNWFRYYDPKTGRYITSDPIGLRGGLNTYLYVNANSLRSSDRWGLESPIDEWPPAGMPSQPIPGYNYCGPGYLPRSPSNALDNACRDHDECYAKCGLDSSAVSIFNPGQCNGSSCQDGCDDDLCEAAGIRSGWIKAGVRYLFCD